MSFRFSLAAVLRIRQNLEEREERVLGEIARELGRIAQSLVDLDAEVAATALRHEGEMRTVQAASELHWAYGSREELKQRRSALEQRRLTLSQLRLQQIRVYEVAHRNRKMLSDLRDERRETYDANLGRLEQMTADDNFNARRNRT